MAKVIISVKMQVVDTIQNAHTSFRRITCYNDESEGTHHDPCPLQADARRLPAHVPDSAVAELALQPGLGAAQDRVGVRQEERQLFRPVPALDSAAPGRAAGPGSHRPRSAARDAEATRRGVPGVLQQAEGRAESRISEIQAAQPLRHDRRDAARDHAWFASRASAT